ncbi:hypothetical protein ACL655_01260 [Klebsiella quasipneumoniae subsp. similipneumoniae]
MTFSVSLAQQRIDFTVPQAAMLNRPRDYIPRASGSRGSMPVFSTIASPGVAKRRGITAPLSTISSVSLQPG